jgi:hypothetical protein
MGWGNLGLPRKHPKRRCTRYSVWRSSSRMGACHADTVSGCDGGSPASIASQRSLCDTHAVVLNSECVPCVLKASLEKKLRAANLQKRNAERSNELSAVMREVRLLRSLPARLQTLVAC